MSLSFIQTSLWKEGPSSPHSDCWYGQVSQCVPRHCFSAALNRCAYWGYPRTDSQSPSIMPSSLTSGCRNFSVGWSIFLSNSFFKNSRWRYFSEFFHTWAWPSVTFTQRRGTLAGRWGWKSREGRWLIHGFIKLSRHFCPAWKEFQK